MEKKVKEKTEIVIKALEFAYEHKLDINSKDDVIKILENVNIQIANENEIAEFKVLLQSADTFLEMKHSRRSSIKTDLAS